MSTVFYGYRIKKTDWWNFADRVRQFYKENHIILSASDRELELDLSRNYTIGELYGHDRKWVTSMKDALTVDLQLFDEDDTYVFRVLELSYLFANKAMNSFSDVLIPVTYDNRTDVPPEEEKNSLIADWVDICIRNHHYLIYPVVSEQDMLNYLFNFRVEQLKQQDESKTPVSSRQQ